jgi:aliphatic nitrilase
LIDQEGIVYADIDLGRCIQPRQMHDITGHYNRFDVFELRVNRRPLLATRFVGGTGADELDQSWQSLETNSILKDVDA